MVSEASPAQLAAFGEAVVVVEEESGFAPVFGIVMVDGDGKVEDLIDGPAY